jgi:propanediol utilization protein
MTANKDNARIKGVCASYKESGALAGTIGLASISKSG